MYLMKTQQPQRNMPPLPPATLVIDMRGEGEEVVDMLRVEVRNLTDEMKLQNVRLWSRLADFISFCTLEPLSEDDLKTLRISKDDNIQSTTVNANANGGSAPQNTGNARGRALTGGADQADKESSFPPQYQPGNQGQYGEIIDDDAIAPHRNFDGLIDEIDRIRNIRHNAVSALGKSDTVGSNVKEPGVRVIFLADARRPNSLSSSSACAAYLKAYYRKLERPNERTSRQIPVNTSVLCLNHQNTDQAVAPTRLIRGLRWKDRWDHLDAVILSEKYRQDIGRVDEDMQALLAELLLYVLLIVSPALAQIRPSAPPQLHEEQQEDENKERISLPPTTYLVGLSSVENSTRWGYRLLNYGLSEQALQLLLEGDLGSEQVTTHNVVEGWLSSWRARLKGVLHNNVPGDIPALSALSRSAKAARPVQGVFSNSQLTLNLGERSIRDLQQYLNTLTATYSASDEQQDAFRQEAYALPAGHEANLPLTLQSAVDSIPQIEREVDEWRKGDPETPLIQGQLEAQRVLGHPRIFLSARKAIPRAKLQLKELAEAVTTLQNKNRQNPVDVKAKQKALQESGTQRIEDLRKHAEGWPLLAAGLGFKGLMSWVTLVFILFVIFFAVTLGFAWLDWVIRAHFPDFVPYITAPLFGLATFTVFYLILWVVLLAALFIALFVIGRILLDTRRTAVAVEVTFCLTLIAITLFGLFISLSLTNPAGTLLQIWYPSWLLLSLPWVSIIAFAASLIIILTEIGYFFWWRGEVEKERASIAEAIGSEHERNIEEITNYIADELAIHMLIRAGLADGHGGTGPYYRRLDDLHTLLDRTYKETTEQRKLAEGRLGSNLTESSLIMREELLDVAALKLGRKRLGTQMESKTSELKELAEMLLRTIGQEMPNNIERQFRERAPQVNREQYYVQILMEALTSVALRFSLAIPASDMLTPLKERYGELDGQVTSQLASLQPLIETLDMKVQDSNLDDEEKNTKSSTPKEFDVSLATQALAAWAQMLWERKDEDLSNALAPGGVMAKLMRDKHRSQTIKEKLGIRTSPSGRTTISGPYDDLYLFVSFSPDSRKFLKDFLPDSYIADFPDPERLVLMHILHYVAMPVIIRRPELGSGAPIVDANGSTGPSSGNGQANGNAATGQTSNPDASTSHP